MGRLTRRCLGILPCFLALVGLLETARAQSTRGLERRCRAGDGAACEALGQREEERGSARRALGYYEEACEAHVATACARAGAFYDDQAPHEGIDPDRARAARFAEKACKLGDGGGCRNLGAMVAEGRGLKKSLARAADLFEEACEDGDAKGCAQAAALRKKKDPHHAAELLRAACDGGHAESCSHLKGGKAGGSERAVRARRACEDGDALSCVTLGYLYLGGLGVEQDQGRAAGLFDQACDAGEASGCRFLASLFQRGEGVRSDDGRAEDLVRKACTLDSNACAGETP
jgi:TPR repeat protein